MTFPTDRVSNMKFCCLSLLWHQLAFGSVQNFTQLIALIEIDNTEQIIMSQFVGYLFFLAFLFFVCFFIQSEHRQKTKLLSFFATKTRQLIVKIFKCSFESTRAYDNRTTRHQLDEWKTRRLSLIWSSREWKNRERKVLFSESTWENIYTHTPTSRCAADLMTF